MKANIKIKFREYCAVLSTEYRHIFKDGGVLLIMVFAILIYSTVYSLAYKKEVLRDIPVAVIDNSKSTASRHLIATFDAAPNLRVDYNPANMDEAKELFFARKVYGVVNIPEDYERDLINGVPTTVGVYVDGSYFLMYRQVFSDVVTGLTGMGTEVEFTRLLTQGATIPQAKAMVNPVSFSAKNLYNPYLGYGTFLMPAIIILIIQQTLLIGIGMIGGTWREFGIYEKLRTPASKRLSTLPIVLGKATVYLSLYALTTTYVLGVHYKIFGYPMNGAFTDIVLFMLPYLLACIFLSIAISTLFRYRENSLLFMLWTSIPLILISGVTLPEEAIPGWLYSIGKIIPSGSGINGFLRIQTMGATLSDVSRELYTLWILVGVYFVLACVGIRMVFRKGDV